MNKTNKQKFKDLADLAIEIAKENTVPWLKSRVTELEDELLCIEGSLIAEEGETRALKGELEEVNHLWAICSDRLDWLEEKMEVYEKHSGTVLRMHSDYYREFFDIKEDYAYKSSGKSRPANTARVTKEFQMILDDGMVRAAKKWAGKDREGGDEDE